MADLPNHLPLSMPGPPSVFPADERKAYQSLTFLNGNSRVTRGFIKGKKYLISQATIPVKMHLP